RRPHSGVGALLAATGLAWFAGNFAFVGWALAGWLAAQVTYLYRGLLVHGVLSYPSGSLRSRRARAVVAAGYAASVAAPVARSDVATIALTFVLVATAAHDHQRARGRERRAHVPAVRAALLVGAL